MNVASMTGDAWHRPYQDILEAYRRQGVIDLKFALAPSLVFHALLFVVLCLIPWQNGALNLEPPRFISIELQNTSVPQSKTADTLVASSQPVQDSYTDDAQKENRRVTAIPFIADSDNAALRLLRPHQTNSTESSPVANERPQLVENAVPKATQASPLPKQDAPTEQASPVVVASRVVSGAAESVMAAFNGKGTPLQGSTATATNGSSSASDRWHAVQATNNWQMQKGSAIALPTPGLASKGYSVDVLVSMQPGPTMDWQDKPDPDAMHEALINASKCLETAEQNREAAAAGLNVAENRGNAQAAYATAKTWLEKAIACAPRDNGLPLSNLEVSVAQVCVDLGQDKEAVQHALLATSLRGGQPATVDEVFKELVSYADLHKHDTLREYLGALRPASPKNPMILWAEL